MFYLSDRVKSRLVYYGKKDNAFWATISSLCFSLPTTAKCPTVKSSVSEPSLRAPDLERTSLPPGGRLVTLDFFHYGGSMNLASLEQAFFFLAKGLRSPPIMLPPATSLADLLSNLLTIMMVQIALLLTGDFIFQPKKWVNWQVSLRFPGLATCSCHQNHLSLWAGTWPTGTQHYLEDNLVWTWSVDLKLASVLNQQPMQESMDQGIWGWITYNISASFPKTLGSAHLEVFVCKGRLFPLLNGK